MIETGQAVKAKRGIYKGWVGIVVSVKKGRVAVRFGRNRKSTFKPDNLEVLEWRESGRRKS